MLTHGDNFLFQLISLYKDPAGTNVFSNGTTQASSMFQLGIMENGNGNTEVASLKKKIQDLEIELQV